MPILARMLIVSVVVSLSVGSAWSKPTHPLHSGRKPGDTDRVVALLEVGGEVSDNLDNKVRKMRMNVVCNLDYEERLLQVPNGSDVRLRSARYYDKATAVIKVEDEAIEPVLRPGRRLIGIDIELPKVTLFSPDGTLTRDELDLIDVLGNSLVLDRLLPDNPVAIGDSWKHSEKLMVALLGLDAASRADVQSVLSEVTDTSARMEMDGRVEGALGGVSTEIELKAKYRFDLRSKRIDWFALLVKEKRSIGHVKRGVDAVARLQVRISPQAVPTHLADVTLKDLSPQPTAQLNQLSFESDNGGWQIAHDRCWYVTGDHPNLTILRMLDRGELVGQCNVSSLPKLAPGKEVTLTEFQNDVKQALGESFGEFVEAAQKANDADYRVYRVVVRGEVSEMPIQWNYYLIMDRHGHQTTLAFSVAVELVERFNEADRKLVESLRFIETKMASNGQK